MLEDAETGVAGQKQLFLAGEQMRLAVDLEHARRPTAAAELYSPSGARSENPATITPPVRPARRRRANRNGPEPSPGSLKGISASGDAYR